MPPAELEQLKANLRTQLPIAADGSITYESFAKPDSETEVQLELAFIAFWAAAKTSRADVVPDTCSAPSTPSSIHPAFTASNISSAGPVWLFGMPNCSNASAHLARG